MLLLHRLAAFEDQSIFKSIIEHAQKTKVAITEVGSSESAVERLRISDWSTFASLPEFDVMNLATLTYEEERGFEYWRKQHVAAGRDFPDLISNSLSKPILYASANAPGILLSVGKSEETKPSHRTSRPKAPDELSSDSKELLVFLNRHHGVHTDAENFASAGKQTEIARKLDERRRPDQRIEIWNQTRVSRAFTNLFTFAVELGRKGGGDLVLEAGAQYKKARASDVYKNLCEDGRIITLLEKLELEMSDR